MRLIFGILFVALVLSACSKPKVEVPADVISKDSMIRMLTDMHLAEAAIQMRNLSVTIHCTEKLSDVINLFLKSTRFRLTYLKKVFAGIAANPKYFQGCMIV